MAQFSSHLPCKCTTHYIGPLDVDTGSDSCQEKQWYDLDLSDRILPSAS